MASTTVRELILPPCASFDAPDVGALSTARKDLEFIRKSMVQLRAPTDEKPDDAEMVVVPKVVASAPVVYHTPALVAAAF